MYYQILQDNYVYDSWVFLMESAQLPIVNGTESLDIAFLRQHYQIFVSAQGTCNNIYSHDEVMIHEIVIGKKLDYGI